MPPQATRLHLMGLDHTKLTYRHAGRDFRLTDVAGNVMQGILTQATQGPGTTAGVRGGELR